MTETRQIRLMIVDDHRVVRSGLSAFLLAYDDLELVAEASGGEEAVRLCAEVKPDVVLMDLVMPGMDGIAATKSIRERCPKTQVIALTSFGDQERVQAALRAGAIGYLLKDVSDLELVAAVRKNVTIDWTVRENVRASLRVIVKRILRKYGYPPDKQEKATLTVLEQAELLSEGWAVA